MRWFCILGLVLSPLTALAEDFHVGPAELAGAMSSAGASDTILLADGDYALMVTTGICGTASYALTIRSQDSSEPTTVNVGSTVTLPAGSQAKVENSGSLTAAVLDFGIPTGPAGHRRPAGC